MGIGKLVEDDRSGCPFLVEGPDGCMDWYRDGAIKVVRAEEATALTPLRDSFEGVAMMRFPVCCSERVTTSVVRASRSWYAEIEVRRGGKSQPCVGWGVLPSGGRR